MSQPTVCLAGYFGCHNLGDDAILLGLLEGIRKHECHAIVLSGSPEETTRLYGVEAVPRRELGACEGAIRRSHVLLFPGGSIFQDVTSVRSVAYYQRLTAIAKKAGVKVAMVGQGVGPLKTFLGKKLAKSAYDASEFVAVRDPGSVQSLQSLGVKTKIHLTADMALLLPKPRAEENVPSYEAAGMPAIGIAPRPFGKGEHVAKLFAEVAQEIMRARMMPVFIEMDQKEDGELIRQIDKMCGGKVPSIRGLQMPMQLLSRMARLEGLIAMRLHAGILGACAGIAPMMVSYDPKVTALARLFDLPTPISIDKASPQQVAQNFLSMHKEQARWNERVAVQVAAQRELAEGNIALVRDLLGLPELHAVGAL